jgi:hypothetical protein
MAQFNYTLPSGAEFTMQTPDGTTQAQADYTFYSQVAAGALVGFVPGQSISSTTSSLVKFNLSRLDRGIAGVDDTVILAIINGLPIVANVPSLINTPLTNPITQANIAAIAGTGFTAPAIGTLTSTQTQALMAQVVNNVDQAADIITDETGVGQYGFSCQQLEMAGYVKPGTWQQFLQNGSGTLVEVLSAPGVWTGLIGIYSLTEFLNSTSAQNDAQARLMQDGYSSLQAAGVITTPDSQLASTVVGEVYTGSNAVLTTATTTITNDVNSQVAALVTNSSQYGTALTAQWATGLPPVTNATSNQTSIQGITPAIGLGLLGAIGIGSLGSFDFASVKTAMDTLGKSSQFASTATSTLGLDKLSNFNLDNATAKLEGQAKALAGQVEGQAKALTGQLQKQADTLVAQAKSQADALIAQGQGLVTKVEKAAGFANTVDRATVDVAFTKVLGSDKIPTPSFGPDLPGSASIGAALDIDKAKTALQNIQGQGTALLNQAQGQTTALLNQAQGQATALAGQAQNTIAGASRLSQTSITNVFTG